MIGIYSNLYIFSKSTLFMPVSFERQKRDWYSMHAKQVEKVSKDQAKVVLLGDSLVANLA